jgi:hypothetical protein
MAIECSEQMRLRFWRGEFGIQDIEPDIPASDRLVLKPIVGGMINPQQKEGNKLIEELTPMG